MSEVSLVNAGDLAERVAESSRALAGLSASDRKRVLEQVACELERSCDEIVGANQIDLEIARKEVDAGTMTGALYSRLKLDREKLAGLVKGIRQVAELPDLLGHADLSRELDEGLTLHRVACPVGVVLVIFESRPDVLPQIISLLIKSGNGALIKGGREARHTVDALFAIIAKALKQADYPASSLALLHRREDVSELLKRDDLIDLVIPRGSNELVKQIQDATRITVLGHADGICHIYVDRSADAAKTLRIVRDAKCQYPAACNSVETVLIHKDRAAEILPELVDVLKKGGVEVRCDEASIAVHKLQDVRVADETDWQTEYCDLIVSITQVDSLDAAIKHINKFGSRHTDAIITEDRSAFEKFATEVDSAGVYLNASTRFADGFRYGFGAEVGISTGKLHPRGPVGVEGLLTYKYRLIGDGHIVEDYSGPSARSFTHRDL